MSRCWCAQNCKDVQACAAEENRLVGAMLALGESLFRDDEVAE